MVVKDIFLFQRTKNITSSKVLSDDAIDEAAKHEEEPRSNDNYIAWT